MAKKKAATRSKKTREVNKSQAIRDYYADHPDDGPTVAARELTKQGIEVSAAYVSGIRAKMKAKMGQGPKRKRRKSAKKPAAHTSPVQDVMQAGQLFYQAIDLVVQAGAKEAKSLVDLAGKVVERVTNEKKK